MELKMSLKDYPNFNTRESYFVPGTYYWICPKNINWVKATVIGGGGAGGSSLLGQPSGGGGAGGFYQSVFEVVPNNTYTITVGQGGIPGTDLGKGIAHGTDSSLIVGIAYGGLSPTKDSPFGIGGNVNCLNSLIYYQGGNGGSFISKTINIITGGGGGGGIGLAQGANGYIYNTSLSTYVASGSGAGSFGGHGGQGYTISGEAASGGGGSIGFPGGDAGSGITFGGVTWTYAGAGSSPYGKGLRSFGGPDIQNNTNNASAATANLCGGAGSYLVPYPATTQGYSNIGFIGSAYMPSFSVPGNSLPPIALFFYNIFGTCSGSCSGSLSKSYTDNSTVYTYPTLNGQDSLCGGGSGAVASVVSAAVAITGANNANNVTCYGGNSYICGGGGGSVGNNPNAIGGSGAGGGGGGGGLIGGNGGDGLIILEW